MVFKMILFPYGMFNLGETDMYTEGLVGSTGFQNLNPLFVDYNDLDREVSRVVFSGLMKYDPDTQTIVSDMATLTINDKKLEYTLTLKDNLKWQDGESLTADDVIFTFKDIVQSQDFPNEILKANFDGVVITKIDDKTVKFVLAKPNVFFITSLTIGVLPKHILAGVPVMDLLKNEFNKMPIGSGPYKVIEPIENFKDGRMQVRLRVNEYYYSDKPKIEYFRFISYPTIDQLMEELNAVNGIVKVSGKYADYVRSTEEFVMFPYQLPQYKAIFMNMDSPKLKDKKVRIALQKAVNKNDLIDLLQDKVAVDTPLLELNQKQWVYKPSMEEANGAIFDAGYRYAGTDSLYRTDSKGNVIELRVIAREFLQDSDQTKETETVLNYLKKQWESIGIKVNIEILPVADFNEKIMDRNYDLLFIGQTLGYSMDTYSYWHSSQVGAEGLNLSNYKSFKVDSLIENVRYVFDVKSREAKLIEIAKALSEDIPAIFLYKPVYYYASDAKVDGIDVSGIALPSDRFSRIDRWQFAQK